jgi:RHS repeat-associated protein
VESLSLKDGEYPLFDGLGSERTVTNSSQTTTGTIINEAFGLTVATTGSSTDPYKFAATSGYRDDGDAGLSHVGARYYDAQVGRFITRDTDLDQHPYLYCEHDPVNNVDPTGHEYAMGFGIADPHFAPLPAPVRGAIVGAGTIILVGAAAAILFPVASATVGGGIIVGIVGGSLGGIAKVGWGTDDPDDVTWPAIRNGAIGGAIGGGIGGGRIGPGIARLIRPAVRP